MKGTIMMENQQAALKEEEAAPQENGHAVKTRRRKKTAEQAETAATSEPVTENGSPRTLPKVEMRGWDQDNNAGVQRMSYANRDSDPKKKRFEIWLKFRDGKPSDEVRQIMKDGGFRWHSDAPEAGEFKGEGAWAYPVGYPTGHQDRLHTERVYAKVVDQMYKEKGIERTVESPAPF